MRVRVRVRMRARVNLFSRAVYLYLQRGNMSQKNNSK